MSKDANDREENPDENKRADYKRSLKRNHKGIVPLKKTVKLNDAYFFLLFGFTPCKAEQPLRGMELQEKEAQKD